MFRLIITLICVHLVLSEASFLTKIPDVPGISSTGPGVSCDSTAECKAKNLNDKHIVCANKLCRCSANYHWNAVDKSCDEYTCKSDVECQEYDKHRICLEEEGELRCACNEVTVELKDSKLCFPRIYGPCNNTDDCAELEPNQVCIKNKCECKPNYEFPDKKNSPCQKILCNNNYDCHANDPNRICSNDKECVCRDGFKESSDDYKCHKLIVNY